MKIDFYDEDMYEDAVNNAKHYGLMTQLDQTAEECAELIKACMKMKRSAGIGQNTDASLQTCMKDLMEEMADVQYMLKQLQILLGVSDEEIRYIITDKQKRSADRINM